MGRVFFGAPPELCLRLRDAFGLQHFVETGTYRGGTAVWAAANFAQVHTIEGWMEYYQRTSGAHRDKTNIEFIYGDSRAKLPEVLSKLDSAALIWLDAHYLGDSMLSAGTPGECPLVDELKAIGRRGVRHFILIDDLHCFQGQLNRGSHADLWPDVAEVHRLILDAFPDYFVVDYEDIVIGVPPEARAVVSDYMTYPGLRWFVPTSNQYVNALNPFSYLFNKHVGERQTVEILRYDVRPPKLPPNFHNTSLGPQENYTWAGGVASYLCRPEVPRHFILMLEDYWITQPVDLSRLEALWQYAQNHPLVGKIDLSGDRMKTPHKDYPDLDLVESTQAAPFRASLQAAIWSRDYLRECCTRGEWDAWQFEKHAAQRDGRLVLGTREPLIAYVNAVGGQGRSPGVYDHKKIPDELWQELKAQRLVA